MDNNSNHLHTIAISILTLVAGALIGLYADSIKSRFYNKLEYLDVKVRPIENYINTPVIAADELNILWKNTPIESISSLSIEFFNFSRVDYENVSFKIELTNKNKKELKVIALQIEGEDGRKELIENIKSDVIKNYANYTFTSKLINRTQKEHANVTFTLLIAGDSIPEYKVFIAQKGLATRPYDSSNANVLSELDWLLIFFIGISLYTVHEVYDSSKRNRDLIRKAAEAIEHKYTENSMKNIKVRDILHELRVVQWNRLPLYKRLLSIKPKRDDLFF